MKQEDFKPCVVCGKGIMHARSAIFYRVKIERMVVNMHAVREQAGLELMLGNAVLAHAMGGHRDMASAMDANTGLVCLSCALPEVAHLAQRMADAAAPKTDEPSA